MVTILWGAALPYIGMSARTGKVVAVSAVLRARALVVVTVETRLSFPAAMRDQLETVTNASVKQKSYAMRSKGECVRRERCNRWWTWRSAAWSGGKSARGGGGSCGWWLITQRSKLVPRNLAPHQATSEFLDGIRITSHHPRAKASSEMARHCSIWLDSSANGESLLLHVQTHPVLLYR